HFNAGIGSVLTNSGTVE
nr:L-asparaginase isoform A {peptide 14k p2} {EC 3.5.1.1} [Lupinus arboreus, developing seeds, Peptide Partial, 17 aa] [Lupinus arboreus]